jgi:hypothetical protein
MREPTGWGSRPNPPRFEEGTSMTPRTIRKAERAAHLVWGLVIGLHLRAVPSWGEAMLRWLVVPAIAASGFAMWFAAPLRRLARRVRDVSRARADPSDAPLL